MELRQINTKTETKTKQEKPSYEEIVKKLENIAISQKEKLESLKITKSNIKQDDNIHKNHRQRLKSQFITNGLCSLTDVQKLELLLFYAIPQKDTNPISHKLINKFGSLSGVFSANYNDLIKVDGVKENTATLICLTKSMQNAISLPELSNKISGSTSAKQYCSQLFVGVDVEQFYIICLNKNNSIKAQKMLKSGTADEIEVQIRSITEFALSNNCNRIIICHNHPNGYAVMSDEDCRFTYSTICSCVLNSIEVLDHIIVGTNGTISLYEQEIIQMLKEKAAKTIQLPNGKISFLSSLAENYTKDN